MLRKYLPRSLYARIILIVIFPLFVMQSVITYVFFARHWDLVTANLSANVSGQIALVTRLYGDTNDAAVRNDIEQWAFDDLGLSVRYDENSGIPVKDKLSIFNVYNSTFDRQLEQSLAQPYWFNTRSYPAFVEVRVQLAGGQLVFLAYRDRVFATTGPIFLFWLVSTTILLGAIAIVFLRNQVRSILRLANAADAFGRGVDAPDYRPTGATEVRKAGHAFIAMRQRIKRHIDQRTSMLAGVSHDLRTPLTRMKLALAMQPESSEMKDLRSDVLDMERMVEAYLEFARTESVDEDPENFFLEPMIDEISRSAKQSGHNIHSNVPGDIVISARRSALKRAVSNLVNNGLRHADNVWVDAKQLDRYFEISVEDDGPGIDAGAYEDVFKPFTRLDEARNLNKSGMGLGLTVVRDVARSHGGDVMLDKSEQGGLLAKIRLPA